MENSDKKLIGAFTAVAVVIGLLAAVIFLIANIAGGLDYGVSEGKTKATAERIAPVGTVALASEGPVKVAAPVAAVAATPKSLYTDAGCVACHASGVAGAPVLGNKAAWAGRVGKGANALSGSVIRGLGMMPPRGGSSLSDSDIRNVVDYMLETVK